MLLTADASLDLTAPLGPAQGVAVEAHLDRARCVATVPGAEGTLRAATRSWRTGAHGREPVVLSLTTGVDRAGRESAQGSRRYLLQSRSTGQRAAGNPC